MSAGTCIRTKSILIRLPAKWDGEAQEFGSTNDDNGEPEIDLVMTSARWEDLGRPDILTVTIEPGDLLNVGDSGV